MFSKRLKLLRKQTKISQKELADYLFISQQAVAKWEKEKSTPDPDMLNKIADYFNVSTDYLLGRTDTLNTAGINKDKSDLPPEAVKELENYREYLKQKYKGK